MFSGIKNQQVDVDIKSNTAQLNYVKSQINDIEDQIRRIDNGFEIGDVLKLEAQLERLRQQYKRLSEAEEDVEIKSISAMTSLSKGIDKAMSKIKRFALSLFSIRSIYALLSRASSAYVSQDIELSNKLQAVWVGLGSLIAPIIDGIATALIKGVKYINVFIKALTGVDLLAKAMQKSMNGANKSAKALNKTLAGFDELTNLDTNADISSPAIDTSWIDAFNNVKINTEWADKIKEIGNWIKENKELVIGALTGVAGAILAIKLGLGGIKALGIFALIYGVIQLVTKLSEYLKNLDPTLKNNGNSLKKFGEIVKYIGLTVLGLGLIIGRNTCHCDRSYLTNSRNNNKILG